ncbi:MAG TPA: M28 family metallopeptidase [Gammaproteobacteria bacterium]
MRIKRILPGILPVFCIAVLAACQPQEKAPTPVEVADRIDAQNIRAHMEFLADDLLEGRDTGERGYAIAAQYFATQCKLMGLEPAGDAGSYFQQVTFRRSTFDGGEAAFTLNGKTQQLSVPDDIAISGSYNAKEESVSGGIVFVGFGISAPEFGYDDYANVDVEDKIVMLVRRGAPESFPSDERAYYSSSSYKLGEAVRRGAKGLLLVTTPEAQERYSWERLKGYASRGGLEWISPDGSVPNAHPELKVTAVLNYELQASVFENAPMPLADILVKLEAGEPVSFELPASLDVTRRSAWEEITSPNVACVLPGSDPALQDEYVLFSGHLDHVGTDDSDNPEGEGEDHIYNGAYDNATGIAIMLEVARVYSSMPEAPKRSLLFLAVTAEEKGLLGSEYWAANPTVPIENVSANVNLDMPVLTFPLADVIAYGAEHSELGEIVREQSATQDLALTPDPWPEQVIFVRSDQYSFVKAGVPAVFLVPGWTSTDPAIDGEAEMARFMEENYHELSDDLSLPFDMDSAQRFAAANFLIGLEVANRADMVKWKAGDFFGTRFATEDRMLKATATLEAGK